MAGLKFLKIETEKDALVVERLAKEIWPEYYTAIIGAPQVEYMVRNFQTASAIVGQNKEGYSYFLITNDDEPVGYLSALNNVQDGVLFLSKIYVLKSARGQGIGKEALCFVEGLAWKAKAHKIALMVSKKNIASIKFYERMGFVNTGPVVKDIGSGFFMDDWLMEKKVS